MIPCEQEYCPKCAYPIEPNQRGIDQDRMCVSCGWFGDVSEVSHTEIPLTEAEKSVVRIIDMYRDMCHLEVRAEALCDALPGNDSALTYINRRVEHARHCLLFAFRQFSRRDNKNNGDEI